MGDPQESDWKHMRKIRDALLARLCARINTKAKTIIDGQGSTDYKKFLELYQYIQDGDEVVAKCFDDWRRSTILIRMLCIKREKLFTPEEYAGLSESVRGTIESLENI